MDHQDLIDHKGPGPSPGKNAARRQRIGEVDGAVALPVRVDIVVVRKEQIYAALAVHTLQFVQKAHEIGAECVVAVHGLEILSRGVAQALVDALPMAAVFLMHDLYDIRVFLGKGVGNRAGIVLRAVVDDDDLHPVAAGQDALDAFFHVVLGVVAGNGNSQQLHSFLPLYRIYRLSTLLSAEAITASMS